MRSALVAALILSAGLPAAARTLVVRPGGSIRAALARASAGDRVEVWPGVYREGASGDLNALTITKSGIALVGLSAPGRPVVLENAGAQGYGVWVSPANSAGPSLPSKPSAYVIGASISFWTTVSIFASVSGANRPAICFTVFKACSAFDRLAATVGGSGVPGAFEASRIDICRSPIAPR